MHTITVNNESVLTLRGYSVLRAYKFDLFAAQKRKTPSDGH